MKQLSRYLLAALFMLSTIVASAATFVGDRTDFRDETIYFAMTTRFYDGDPKNNVLSWDKQDVQKSKNDPDWRGDFAGLIEKLDYIKALGFTSIWITPITQNASGEDYHGYHSMDFSNVDLRYESRKEWGCAKDVKFQTLVDSVHAKGMKLVLDIVLNHTSNFGEAKLNPLFTRNQNIANQATPAGALIPNTERLSSNYFDQTGAAQYAERFKFFKNPQYDKHNMYHHYGTGWNWDLPNRWWGQIAGDCVDLNTENNTVAEYLVECYGKFIEMGVDGFRIDTTGHIARLTFNKQFIPQFMALGEKYKNKRLNGAPFYMFGECCARYGGVIYRDQHNLSSHFYTWKSDQSLLDQYDGSQAYWDSQSLNEGHDSPVGPMILCESEKTFNHNSTNVFMQNGAWHEPNYSEASGYNVIDFPMHYNFNDAGQAIRIANEGDKYYNDASFNVVYVDSHDYAPGPNDDKRFVGGTEQWAENLDLMFTFRGIPCIYYGSEVEFKKGKPIDVGGENNKTPRSESGRAYFGEFLKGNVKASDFGVFTASGNVSQTLNSDLARHITRLNQIRAAVPALRKGQYTFDGCSANGGYAFKRAYKDSYALVTINGGGTFTNCPSGSYVDIVTGTPCQYNNGTVTVDAPRNKGQLRVVVKDWKGGKIGEDGKFIYASSAVSKGATPDFSDPGAEFYYTADDVVGNAAVTFSNGGGSFRTATLTVEVALNSVATSGWFKVGNGQQQALTPGAKKSFTIGDGMNYGDTVTVTWGASAGNETYTGSVTYKKVDPNAGITIYVTGMNGANISGTNIHAWHSGGDLTSWPGKALTDQETIGGRNFYYTTFDVNSVNIIFNKGGQQTADIKGIEGDAFFEYDGGTQYKQIQRPDDVPVVTATPGSGTTFTESLAVTLSVTPACDIYYTLDGSTPSASSTKYNGPITLKNTTTIKTFASKDGKPNTQQFVYTKTNSSDPIPNDNEFRVYFDNSVGNWNDVFCYNWDDCHTGDNAMSGKWPGKKLTEKVTYAGKELYVYVVNHDGDMKNPKIIFNPGGDNGKTGDMDLVRNAIYNKNGNSGEIVSIDDVVDGGAAMKVFTYNGQLVVITSAATTINAYSLAGVPTQLRLEAGRNEFQLPRGFYVVNGQKVIL